MCVMEGRVTTISYFRKKCKHQEDQRDPFHTQVSRDIIYPLNFWAWNLLALVQRQVFLNLLLNGTSSSASRDKQRILIWILNLARRFFLLLDVVAESKDDKLIPSSIFPVTDNLVFFIYHLDTLQVNNSLWSLIYQWERPNKNFEDNYEDRGFWDTN